MSLARARHLRHEFRRNKELAEKAMSQLSDEKFFHRPGEQVNPVARPSLLRQFRLHLLQRLFIVGRFLRLFREELVADHADAFFPQLFERVQITPVEPIHFVVKRMNELSSDIVAVKYKKM